MLYGVQKNKFVWLHQKQIDVCVYPLFVDCLLTVLRIVYATMSTMVL